MHRTPTSAKRSQDDEEEMEIQADLPMSWCSVNERAWHCVPEVVPALGPAFLSENSLKHLLTPDKWTNHTIFCIYMQNMERKYAAICRKICRNMQEICRKISRKICRNMQENKHQNKQYADVISLHILHILHIAICKICRIWTVHYFFAYLFAYCSIFICILLHIILHILHILHIAICKICRIWTVHYYFAYYFAYQAYLSAYFCPYSAYSAYCNMQNMQNIDLAVLFCILFCILLHIYANQYAEYAK